MRHPNEKGQASVELALLLPLLLLFLLLLTQIGLLVERQVLVVHVAREAARKAAVTGSVTQIKNDALSKSALEKDRLSFDINRGGVVGSSATVHVIYNDPTDVPLVGPLLPSVKLQATVSTRVEQ